MKIPWCPSIIPVILILQNFIIPIKIFIKNNSNESFIELLNKNRVIYFQELLKSKKYKHFTIEALSEMSGFGTKRSMYNSFKNYVGITPTEFIDSLK